MTLTDADKSVYLANIMAVVKIDLKLSPREAAALDEIRKLIDARKTSLAAAEKMVDGGSFKFQIVGSFADHVRNLEDMLFVALTDSDLDARESELVASFCELIGVYQDQLDKLLADTSKRCDATEYQIKCPACSKEVSSHARFCPGCGQALAGDTEKTVNTGFELPTEGYAIEFCESTAAAFGQALILAKASGSIQTAVKNKKTWHLATFQSNAFNDAIALATILSSMRNRRVYVDAVEVDWQEIFGFLYCANQRSIAYRPIEYCFGKDINRINPWGCRQTQLDWSEWAAWFSYGSWRQIDSSSQRFVFVFDKERIHHEVATCLHRVRFCPYLRTALAEAVIKHLPNEVEVVPGGDWRFSRCSDALPGSIKVVEQKEVGSFVMTDEYCADGVRPRGYSVLGQIWKSAFKDSFTADTNETALLE